MKVKVWSKKAGKDDDVCYVRLKPWNGNVELVEVDHRGATISQGHILEVTPEGIGRFSLYNGSLDKTKARGYIKSCKKPF